MHWAVIKLYVGIIVRIVKTDVDFVKNKRHCIDGTGVRNTSLSEN
jgi:hypothetical protein